MRSLRRFVNDVFDVLEASPSSSEMTPPLESDPFSGCLLGLAVGDMLGAPVEKKGREEARRYLSEHVADLNFEGIRRTAFDDLPFGHVTDDTQLARELAQTLLHSDGFDGDEFALRLIRLFDGNVVGSGSGTRKSVELLKSGKPWFLAGRRGGGNGAAMRAAPAGLAARTEPEAYSIASRQSLATHRSGVSIAGAVAMAVGVFRLEAGRREGLLDRLAEWVVPLDEDFARCFRELEGHLERGLSPDDVLKWVGSLQDRTAWDVVSPYAKTSVLWAFYSFLSTGPSYLDTVERAIWCGGDVDTTAAMAGALHGTQHGVGSIPEELVALLRDEKGRDADNRLKDIAERLRGQR